jgi:hypothetical protein
MTPQEVKTLALTRALTSLADLGARYTVVLDNETHTNIQQRRVLSWARYNLKGRIAASKAGDILRIENQGDDLGKLQSRVCGFALQMVGEGGYSSERVPDEDAVNLYLFSSPIKPPAPELRGVRP